MSTSIDLGGTATAIGALGASLDISPATVSDWEIVLTVNNLSSASGTPGVTIALQHTVDNFTTPITIAAWDFRGQITSDAPVSASKRRDEIPNLPVGTTSAKLRMYVTNIVGTTPTCSATAFLKL